MGIKTQEWPLFLLTSTGGSHLNIPAFVIHIIVITKRLKPIQVGKVTVSFSLPTQLHITASSGPGIV